MKQMLKNTHRKQNIDLLRVRDFYFDKARNLNKLKTLLVYFPAILLVISCFSWLPYYDWVDENRDKYQYDHNSVVYRDPFCSGQTYRRLP